MIEEGHPLKPSRKEVTRLLAYLKGGYALQYAMQSVMAEFGSDAVLRLDYWTCQLVLENENTDAIRAIDAAPAYRHMQRAPSDVEAKLSGERSDSETDT